MKKNYLLALCQKTQGFTLVELIVVILIIGILASTMLPKIMGAPSRARDAGRIAELDQLAIALQSYYADTGSYPAGGCLTDGSDLVTKGYILKSNFPQDPLATNKVFGCEKYFYYKPLQYKGVEANAFFLAANVENTSAGNYAASLTDEETIPNWTNVEAVSLSSTTGNIYIKIGGI